MHSPARSAASNNMPPNGNVSPLDSGAGISAILHAIWLWDRIVLDRFSRKAFRLIMHHSITRRRRWRHFSINASRSKPPYALKQMAFKHRYLKADLLFRSKLHIGLEKIIHNNICMVLWYDFYHV